MMDKYFAEHLILYQKKYIKDELVNNIKNIKNFEIFENDKEYIIHENLFKTMIIIEDFVIDFNNLSIFTKFIKIIDLQIFGYFYVTKECDSFYKGLFNKYT